MSERKVQQANQSVKGKEQEDTKTGGLEFMATRFNVIEKKRQLRYFKQITPGESYLLDEIELATIGGQNHKSTICSKIEMYVKDFASLLGIGLNKVYVQLKSLEEKNLIIRDKTRSPGLEIIGLNPAEFGQILIDKLHVLENKNHLKMIVDNSKNGVEVPDVTVPKEDEPSPNSGQKSYQSGTNLLPKEDKTDAQGSDITGEKSLLDPLRKDKSLLDGEGGDRVALFQGDEEQASAKAREMALSALPWLNRNSRGNSQCRMTNMESGDTRVGIVGNAMEEALF